MTNDKKRVLVIDGPGTPTARQVLAACYGAGLIKQGQIAGEYPPPPVDMPETTEAPGSSAASEGSGTVTGRITRTDVPFQEFSQSNSTANDPRTEHLAKIELADIENRLLANMETPPQHLGRFDCRGNYRWPMAYASGPRKLSEIADGPHPHHDKITRTSINISQMLEQAAVSQDKLEEWQEVLCEAGFRQLGDGPLADTWIKEDDDESA